MADVQESTVIPPELCGYLGCTLLPHGDLHHSWGDQPGSWVFHVVFTREPDDESKDILTKVVSTAATRVGASTLTVSGPEGDVYVQAVSEGLR